MRGRPLRHHARGKVCCSVLHGCLPACSYSGDLRMVHCTAMSASDDGISFHHQIELNVTPHQTRFFLSFFLLQTARRADIKPSTRPTRTILPSTRAILPTHRPI
ncbi:hypothetical protein LY76DRAFT_279245 [Colletotrichum caudatum]|nr:hypothetical protein LY76DRAFT_279245 [Colletotrichum caudatum]